MPDQFSNDLKEFGRISERIGLLQREIEELTAQRDQLRKRLRAYNSVVGQGLSSLPDASDEEVSEAVKAVVDSLREGPARISDIADKLGITPAVAATRLLRAEKAGLIERESRGKYRLKPVHPLVPDAAGLDERNDAGNEASSRTTGC
ncbi:MAG TPA: type IV toxin-antitoxin system AbiEi family antitoxin domain-containing protein [Candidatus Eremiobacteraceae bacterium]|nr:type IV toxin-antitoxin system AbiEi family antitoxin domain-containing protein [Candidatus Eremiobacteraceae bacterium]